MIRDQAILVRPDGSVMFDSPAYGCKGPAESRDNWHSHTVRKALHEQALRGESLIVGERIAIEERPDPKVRNAIRMGRNGKLTVDLIAAKRLLRDRWKAESDMLRGRLEKEGESAAWFDLGAGIEDPAVVPWEERLAVVVSESKRIMGELRLAQSVEDLIAIEPQWPKLNGGKEAL